MIYYTKHGSPLGTLLLTASGQGLCGIYFEEHKHFRGIQEEWQHAPDHSHLQKTIHQLNEYFEGARKTFDVPLDMHGTDFQCKVWRMLSNIKFGQLSTYAAHAEYIGNTKAVRAVGTAIGRNPVSIIVPCHRVVGISGALTGYAGGLERKQFLLTLESPAK